ncbi:MAG: hypothetical protein LUC50_04020, partial [Ruminococcus sp.]|nr:hypothetical protein [Ruminococcus sp.]
FWVYLYYTTLSNFWGAVHAASESFFTRSLPQQKSVSRELSIFFKKHRKKLAEMTVFPKERRNQMKNIDKSRFFGYNNKSTAYGICAVHP